MALLRSDRVLAVALRSLAAQTRIVAGDLAEDVKMIDRFKHPKSGLESRCFRINYRSMDRNLTNEEINDIQAHVRDRLARDFKVELR